MSNHPKHIAFIMDGNNRFIKLKDISKYDGYKSGALKLIKISEYIFNNYDTEIISAFALSKNNTKRSNSFINPLLNVLEDFLTKDLFHKNLEFNIKFIGDLDYFSKKIRSKLNEFNKQKKIFKKTLVIYLNYSGRHDIITASRNYKHKSSHLDNFSKYLSTNGYSNPEILIRTGGFQRLSDFFLFQISFTELFFLKKLWPNLSNRDVNRIINKFKNIERKFGY